MRSISCQSRQARTYLDVSTDAVPLPSPHPENIQRRHAKRLLGNTLSRDTRASFTFPQPTLSSHTRSITIPAPSLRLPSRVQLRELPPAESRRSRAARPPSHSASSSPSASSSRLRRIGLLVKRRTSLMGRRDVEPASKGVGRRSRGEGKGAGKAARGGQDVDGGRCESGGAFTKRGRQGGGCTGGEHQRVMGGTKVQNGSEDGRRKRRRGSLPTCGSSPLHIPYSSRLVRTYEVEQHTWWQLLFV
jgi:hypothetical protein